MLFLCGLMIFGKCVCRVLIIFEVLLMESVVWVINDSWVLFFIFSFSMFFGDLIRYIFFCGLLYCFMVFLIFGWLVWLIRIDFLLWWLVWVIFIWILVISGQVVLNIVRLWFFVLLCIVCDMLWVEKIRIVLFGILLICLIKMVLCLCRLFIIQWLCIIL